MEFQYAIDNSVPRICKLCNIYINNAKFPSTSRPPLWSPSTWYPSTPPVPVSTQAQGGGELGRPTRPPAEPTPIQQVEPYAQEADRPTSRGLAEYKSRTGKHLLSTPARTLAELVSRQTVLNTECLTITVIQQLHYADDSASHLPNPHLERCFGLRGPELHTTKTVTCQ